MDYYDIIKKLIGNIEPVGESNQDELRYHNLGETIELVDKLITDISRAAMNFDRPEYSMSRIGKRAKEYLRDLRECLEEDE
jgi:hypothetical protein